MTKQLIIGLVGEGKTDYRFLNSIVRRTYEELAFECTGDVEVLSVQYIDVPRKKFIEFVEDASRYAHNELGLMILCIHTDADERTDNSTFIRKVTPARESLRKIKYLHN